MRGVSHGHRVARTEHMNRPRRPDLGWIKKDATLSVPVLQAGPSGGAEPGRSRRSAKANGEGVGVTHVLCCMGGEIDAAP